MDVSEISSPDTREKGNDKPYRKLPAWLSPHERTAIGSLTLGAVWEQGRQGTGYEKFNLAHEVGARWIVRRALDRIGNPAHYDAWLLHYPVGSEIPPHTDPAHEGKCHVRLNALVVAGAGGMLTLEGEELPLNEGDAYIFRPDIVEHSVAPIEDGSRLVLSVGANIGAMRAHALGMA